MTNPVPVENPPGVTPPAITRRVQSLLLRPREEWPVIDAETSSVARLFLRYAMVLAAIPALALFLRAMFFGYYALGFTIRPGFAAAFGRASIQYLMALVPVLFTGYITDFLVGKFGGTPDRNKAFRLAIYTSTAVWLAGVSSLVPGLSLLGLFGLYSIYLLYTGLPVLMKVPQEKAALCTAAITLATMIATMAAGTLFAPD